MKAAVVVRPIFARGHVVRKSVTFLAGTGSFFGGLHFSISSSLAVGQKSGRIGQRG